MHATYWDLLAYTGILFVVLHVLNLMYNGHQEKHNNKHCHFCGKEFDDEHEHE